MPGCALLLVAVLTQQQTPVPKPFPQPGSAQPAKPPAPPTSRPSQPPTAQPAPPPNSAPAANPDSGAPTESILGVPIYPGAQYLKSYDAGRGQKFYLYGSTASFVDLVTYYRERLKQRGEL